MKLLTLVENVVLNNHQKSVLLQTFLSDTPRVAYERVSDSESDINGRDILGRLGYLNISDSSKNVSLTDAGKNALTEYGLIDETGEVTEVGDKILKDFDKRANNDYL